MITGYKVERCPFCKATQAYLHFRRNPWQVRCGRCGSEGPEARSEAEAVEGWNKSEGRKQKMSTGNEMTMECVKLVFEEIIGELRSFDETPPPKKVWLDIANRLEKAFGDYREAMMSFMGDFEKRLVKLEDDGNGIDPKKSFDTLAGIGWKETMFLDLQTHDFGGGVFMLRCKHGEPNEHYCIIKALDEGDAISRAVFDLHKPSEQVGNFGKMRNALSTVSAWLKIFDTDVKPRDNTYSASEIKVKVDEALNSRVRNCDRFNDALDAQLEFLNEVWLISVDRESMLERDKFENWTPEMKSRYAEWLMEFKKEEKEAEGEGRAK